MQFEVEQKFRVEGFTATERRLHDLGAREGGVLQQADRYFNHPARDFAKTDEALRLRQTGETSVITYKGPKLDATTKTRREIELPLAAGCADLERYSELLRALGFRFVAEVRKTRRLWHVDWQARTVEVALDQVAGLGAFVELELSASETDLAAAKTCIASLAAELGLVENERRSYLELLQLASVTSSLPLSSA